jgi:antitoxin CptB
MFEPRTDQERLLQWRCRRGLKELDVLIQPFLDDGYRELDEAQQAAFARLMTHEDPDLLDWFLRQSKPDDPELEQLVERIRHRMAG